MFYALDFFLAIKSQTSLLWMRFKNIKCSILKTLVLEFTLLKYIFAQFEITKKLKSVLSIDGNQFLLTLDEV